MAQRLNPKAPTFMAGLFRKQEKDSKERPEGKSKGKERAKDKDKTPGLVIQGADQATPTLLDDSPSEPRKSRDTFSVHTQTSVSESRESLNLEATHSNTPSEPSLGQPSSLKEQDNVVKKLFRKGSSSRFNLARLGKDSGALFKKGPGSATNSDRNVSAERSSSVGDPDEDEGVLMLGKSYDSTASSPALGPAKSRDGKEVRKSSWFGMKKKGPKEKESLDIERRTLTSEAGSAADEEK